MQLSEVEEGPLHPQWPLWWFFSGKWATVIPVIINIYIILTTFVKN